MGTLVWLSKGGYSAQIDMYTNVEGARAHLDTHYPALAYQLVHHRQATRMEVEIPCW